MDFSTQECFELNGKRFYRTSYFDIVCIRCENGYYNFTKIAQDNGYSDIAQITRLAIWKRKIEAFKRNYLFDVRRCLFIQKLSCPADYAGELYKEISKDLLSFTIQTREESLMILNGTYMPEELLHFFCEHVNDDYAVRIAHLITLIHRETKLRNITLEQKIEEQVELVERLTRERDEAIRRDEESNRGFDHHRAGTILLQLLAERSRRGVTHPPNCYTMKIRETEVTADAHPHEIIISNIFNIDRMKTLIYFYAKNCELDFVSVYKTKLIIPNIDAFKTFVSSLQSFAFDPPYNIDSIIERYTTEHKTYSPKYIGEMFELYCSKVFNLRWYKLDRTEKLALLKYDRGIDLISIDDRVIAQCKYYKTNLELDRLTSFRDCCQAFEGWSHILIVNSSAELSTEIKESKDWTIRRIPDKEFEDFLSPFIAELEERPKPEIKPVNLEKLRFKYSTDMMKQIHDFISSKLDETPIPVSEAIELVNSSFELNKPINERKLFTICHDLYKRSNQGTLPTNSKGERLLIQSVSYEAQEEFIISTITYGEYIRDEFIPIFNKRFKETLNSKGFTKRFSRLFITKGSSNTLPTRYFNSKEIAILELKPRYVPNRNREFSNFIDSNSTLSKEELIEAFNSQFHRYETVRSWNKLIESLSETNEDDELESFITTFTVEAIEANSKNDVYNAYCELVANPLSRSAFNDEMNSRFRDARLLIDGHRVHVWKRLLNEAK